MKDMFYTQGTFIRSHGADAIHIGVRNEEDAAILTDVLNNADPLEGWRDGQEVWGTDKDGAIQSGTIDCIMYASGKVHLFLEDDDDPLNVAHCERTEAGLYRRMIDRAEADLTRYRAALNSITGDDHADS